LFKNITCSYTSAVFSSIYASKDERAPEQKVNIITPEIISTIQNILDVVVCTDISPYPTVVIVVQIK
jgi:hypothetical protein